MNEVAGLFLILLVALSGYTAGRLHGQLGYRHGYRYGYRQGYFDGDRASWNRRRRELQAAVASVLRTPAGMHPQVYPTGKPAGTTYTSTTYEMQDDQDIGVEDGGAGRHSRNDWALVDAGAEANTART